MQFKIEPTHLRACIFTMSKEESRYYLKGVHVYEKNGDIYYESTNGHCLVRTKSMIEQENDITGLNIIIPDSFAQNLAKKSFLKGFGAEDLVYLDAVVDAQTLSIEMPGGITSNKLINGTFPETGKMFLVNKRGTKENAFLGVNLKYVAAIGRSLKAFYGSTGADIGVGDNTDPIYFSIPHSENGHWEALIMPMRANEEPSDSKES